MRNSFHQPDFRDEMPRQIKPITKQPDCLLEAMEQITETARKSQMTDDYFKAVQVPTKYMSDKLGFTPTQSVLFALLVDRSEDNNIHLSELAAFTGCSTTRILRLSKSLEELERQFYIRIRRGRNIDSYRVPREVIISLRDDIPYVRKTKEITTVSDFFDSYRVLFQERDNGEISYDMFRNLCEENLEIIKDTHFSRTLQAELCSPDDRVLFIHMAHLYVSNLDDNIGFRDIEDIYDDGEVPNEIKGALRSQELPLQVRLIENLNNDGIVDSERFKLTDYAKEDLLCELNLNAAKNGNNHLTKHDSLIPKALIYNERENEHISQLTSLLMPERFAEVRKNLENAGMRKGFCCLFYGAPGTGKTETVYQIARQTGRDIMQVDVDRIKSCWVGESEKNIKHLFQRYRNICEAREIAPILLFNEADAVLGIRMEGATRGVDKMENSIQTRRRIHTRFSVRPLRRRDRKHRQETFRKRDSIRQRYYRCQGHLQNVPTGTNQFNQP
ncbi:MAG: ATP-binding protein [Muribaculum sp.]|nr:ATP-binding protein [Muribaculum sp.]